MARERKATWLFQIDNDQCFWPDYSPLDVLASAGMDKDVVGIPTMQRFDSTACGTGADPLVPNFRTLDGPPETDGEFLSVTHVGWAAIFLNHRVWEAIPGPWFKFCQNESSELREIDGRLTEDFSELARRHGFKVWCHRRLISHWKTAEMSELGMFFQTAKQMAARANVPMPTGPAKWEDSKQAKGAAR